MKNAIKNERIKRKFFRWLKEADGCCVSTVNNIEKAIILYEDFTKNDDFVRFNPDRAIKFKKWLKNRQHRGKAIALTTYHTYLRYLRKFFSWLAWQNGYKSKISPDVVDYLKITEKEERMATQYIPRNYPALEYVLNLVKSIKVITEIDKRDRALIAFTLLTGMRDNAIVSLPLGCFDEENLVIKQNPLQGVQTKFSKYISSVLFRFDKLLVKYVLDWVKHLKNKGFGSQDPLFPKSKTEKLEGFSFVESREVEAKFWKNASRLREIFKSRAKDADLKYFPPHTFRHLAIDLALKRCKSGDQIKAISQNFGHEHIATTLSGYANYTPQKLGDVLSQLNFSANLTETDNDTLEKIRQLVLTKQNKTL